MKTMKIAAALLVVAVGGVLQMACVASTDSVDESGEDAPVSETEQALGETACETVTVDDNLDLLDHCGNYDESFSPDASYGQGSSCPNQYVVDLNQLAATGSYAADWGEPLPTTQSACEAARMEVGYYSKTSLCNVVTHQCWPQWHVETTKLHGVWEPNQLGADECFLHYDAGYSAAHLVTTTGYTEWRMAGRAYSHSCGVFCIDVPKKMMFSSGRPPC